MPVKSSGKIITAAIGLFGLIMTLPSHAIPIIFSSITMEVRSTGNIRVNGGDTAASLLARFNNGTEICTVNIEEFTGIGGKQNCGTNPHDDLATLYTVNYSLGNGMALFQLGADWGLGGIIMGGAGGDSIRTDDIWWGYSWNNADVLNFTLDGPGTGSFQLLGFESCCSGANSLRVSVNGGQTFSSVMTSVPEPAALALLGFGLMGLTIARRRLK
ncbi:MAG: CCXG family PEP-CTERM protein [Emcibacter sp.]|nr:CCXG family PEP-CTERM protein [Emcibacter sp.]